MGTPLEGNQGIAPQARKFCILGTTEVRLLGEKHQLQAPTILVKRTKTPSNVFDLDGQKQQIVRHFAVEMWPR